MSLATLPLFYFVDPIGVDNNTLNFVEPNVGPTELTATLLSGSRSMTDLMNEVARAMNEVGSETYTASFDRTTRIVTILSTDTVELLVATGANAGTSTYVTLGFTGADLTGAATYDGDTAMGTEYSPQFLIQNFKSFDDNKEGILSSINESAQGIVEVVTFGFRQIMEINIKYVTDRVRVKGAPIENNQNALAELRTFLDFCISKSDLEFMADRDTPSIYTKVLLESTRSSKQGTGYDIREMTSRGLDGYFETGTIKFRKVS